MTDTGLRLRRSKVDIHAAAEAVIRLHARARKRRVAPWGPGDLRKAASRPRRAEKAMDYSISGDLDYQYSAPGSYAGDFGGGGGTQHATRVGYVAGQTDAMSGEYARSSVDDVGRWRNNEPFAGLDRKAFARIRRAARLALVVKKHRRAAVHVPATRPEPAGLPDPYGFIRPNVPEPASTEFLPVQPGGGYDRIVYGMTRYGGRAKGRMRADIRWEGRPDRKVPVTNEGAIFDPIGDILKEAEDRGY